MRHSAVDVVVIFLAAPYTLLNLASPNAQLYGAGLLVGVGACAALVAGGRTPADLALRLARPSSTGLAVTSPLVLAFPTAAVLGRLTVPGVSAVSAAVVSSTAQEAYFRGALQRVCIDHWGVRVGIVVQATLFAAWHARALAEASALLASLAIVGALITGLLLGYQVHRDRSLALAWAAHALFLMFQ